ncbi:SRPBCC domain-containing protein [Streptosporangium vulgare]|uniref:SRPBCC domain-containing protein n=1 Tax=Streptosporangium vulgare TaxID=46190 RepID=UPI0031D891CA
MSETSFVYVSYIMTTPERLWEALTGPAFISATSAAGVRDPTGRPGPRSSGRSPRTASTTTGGQRVLEAEPGKRLSYTWHNYEREVADLFGWSDEKLAELRKEPISKITFEIEPAGGATVKLTVTHEGLVAGSEMIKGVSQGWPEILSNLKTLLESGETLPLG